MVGTNETNPPTLLTDIETLGIKDLKASFFTLMNATVKKYGDDQEEETDTPEEEVDNATK